MSNATTITAVQGLPVIDVERVLDAPVADVYRAYTDPALIAQWLGPRGYAMDVRYYDARDGGGYHYVHSDGSGNSFEFQGVFHSVQPRERIVQTFEFLGAPGHVSLESVSFTDVDGATRVNLHAVYQSVEDRDAMIASGMEHGVREGYERLDELLVA